MITVKYFASLRETLGRDQDTLDADSVATVRDVWSRVADNSDLPSHLLIAVNMEYADPQHPVKDGDEVAFFPPVTGG
jgi:molybdopterin synthase sulfur carrier subunit